MKKKISKVYWMLDAEALAELRGCKDCKVTPAVFLTAKQVPCCRLHWEKFADGMGVAIIELVVPKVEERIRGILWSEMPSCGDNVEGG